MRPRNRWRSLRLCCRLLERMLSVQLSSDWISQLQNTIWVKASSIDMVDMAHECGADTIVVDDDLTPTQLSTIEEAARLKVIDRSEVILDIFLTRATSKQAILQVELAQLEYELPRLARKWTHLERLGGGIGTRGPGESQIETDRRIIRRKISFLRSNLA